MYSLYGHCHAGNGFVINHIPPIVTANEFGTVLFGEDPGNIIDELQYDIQIEKLTR